MNALLTKFAIRFRLSVAFVFFALPAAQGAGWDKAPAKTVIDIPIRALDPAHLVTEKDVAAIIFDANQIFESAGIRFYGEGQPDSVKGIDCVCSRQEIEKLMANQSPSPAIRVYFVRKISWAGGAPGMFTGVSAPNSQTIVLADQFDANLRGLAFAHEIGHLLGLYHESSAIGNLMNETVEFPNSALTPSQIASVRKGAVELVKKIRPKNEGNRAGEMTVSLADAATVSITSSMAGSSETVTLSASHSTSNVQSHPGTCMSQEVGGARVHEGDDQRRCYALDSDAEVWVTPISRMPVSKTGRVNLRLVSGPGCEFSLVLESSAFDITNASRHLSNARGGPLYVDFVIAPKQPGDYELELRAEAACSVTAQQTNANTRGNSVHMMATVVTSLGLTAYQSAILSASLAVLTVFSIIFALPFAKRWFESRMPDSA